MMVRFLGWGLLIGVGIAGSAAVLSWLGSGKDKYRSRPQPVPVPLGPRRLAGVEGAHAIEPYDRHVHRL
jgi:hypothetical protein